MADPRGFLKVRERELPPNRPVEVRLRDWKDVHAHRQDGQPYLKEQAGRCMDCGIPFCHNGCPLGNLIPEWNDLVWRGQWSERPELIRYDEITPRFNPKGKPARAESFIGPMSRTMSSLSIAHRPGAFLDTALFTVAWQQLGDVLYRRNYDDAGGQLIPAMKATREKTRSDSFSARGELRFLSADKKRGGSIGSRNSAASFNRNRRSARILFSACERDSPATTVVPVGTCASRIELLVLLRFCPPGPGPRNTSTRTWASNCSSLRKR